MEDFVNAIAEPLIAVVVPVVIAGIKLAWDRIPKFLLPVVAPFLGIAADFVISWGASVPMMGWKAALLGMAGVGLREVVDQVKRLPQQ